VKNHGKSNRPKKEYKIIAKKEHEIKAQNKLQIMKLTAPSKQFKHFSSTKNASLHSVISFMLIWPTSVAVMF